MSDTSPGHRLLTRISVAAFALVTLALLLPGHLKRWQAPVPRDGAFYTTQAFERRTRVFHGDGHFGRLAAGLRLGEVVSFECISSAAARREFGWRGAREVIFDCPTVFRDTGGAEYTWVFRLIPNDDPLTNPAPEGYGTFHIDAGEARAILEAQGMFP
ncbi:hypothetical protein KQ247_15490 [Ruegeria pomeroyi]|jgi:hypothetical protein|uniref:Uncharacterized protein n=2 Tax=Ruegeria pomeroyi TaxID=89184 RepID=V5UYW8_RUEPO|nr:hypothetical protein [Ruegeria pomeroyi]HCE72030.1 hypothetical protein [Ruegeria sp.]AHB86018.1 hypothetical protein SPO1337a [Ruegeria pomeroyi DSS-3]NVK98469.1 hypothetical protein [Ruegeria pomeroyi]NVL03390.1 hypothetical protein [Ruegeria pomeroyi]QWV08208.1 hypothetical protein KQ247_15490 [Ruegeria pomeroyi]